MFVESDFAKSRVFDLRGNRTGFCGGADGAGDEPWLVRIVICKFIGSTPSTRCRGDVQIVNEIGQVEIGHANFGSTEGVGLDDIRACREELAVNVR